MNKHTEIKWHVTHGDKTFIFDEDGFQLAKPET